MRGAVLLLSLLLASASPAAGSDARLDPLFRELKGSVTAERAGEIEAEIWNLWSAPPPGRADVELLMEAAGDHIRHEEYDRAVAALDEAVRLAPLYAEAWNRRATAHYHAGDYAASVSDIARTLELEPRHFPALAGLGLINMALGRMREALANYEAALAINPHFRPARLHAEALRELLKGDPT
ncbi:MAG TPA: tetratricopeptide repeat protein [Azospirillaceae bacterium]|nr:tetratricopeptide repeat protein [Azospirillaceae bacterium]